MFGSNKKKKSDAQEALEERGKAYGRDTTDPDFKYDTIVHKDDYWAIINNWHDSPETIPSWIAYSDLTKEGYTFVCIVNNQAHFQKLPK